MAEIIISNTSPLLYLHRIDAVNWLPRLCEEVWIPHAVAQELSEGMRRGYEVPDPQRYEWLTVTDPHAVPSQWLNVDLGAGELAVLALALEHSECVVLLDDRQARRIAQSAGLSVWGTLRVLIEAKSQGLIQRVGAHVDRLEGAGMWISAAIRRRVLALPADRQRAAHARRERLRDRRRDEAGAGEQEPVQRAHRGRVRLRRHSLPAQPPGAVLLPRLSQAVRCGLLPARSPATGAGSRIVCGAMSRHGHSVTRKTTKLGTQASTDLRHFPTSNWITRVATDVGGTFTDLVRFDIDPESGQSRVTTAKTATTPLDFERGVLDVLRKGGVPLREIDFLAHGTTVVINALTERKGAKVGLITTEGFRDTLEIARGNRPDLFNLLYEKPKPFVARYLRRELPGRMSYRGTEMRPLDLSPLAAIVEDFRSDGVQAVAICFLHSYANPAHESAAEAEVRRLWPEVHAVSSHRIAREWREYERTSTTVLSAYVQPTAERYLRRLSDGLASRGFAGSPYVMQSNGGIDSLEAAARTPITMIESGPSSGVWGAAQLGALIGDKNIIALDIGGTTAKCSLIDRGNIKIVTDYWIGRDGKSAGYPVMVPVVDMVEIGNGGGSIAWVDDLGKLHVGPRSAGAVPGPAAYGMGGRDATTTDANLWLGRINRDYFCGGELNADMDAVEAVLRDVGGRPGLGPDQAAAGIVRIANNNMVNALKLVSLNRGFDPREFTLIAFGGGGGMHAVALAGELGISKVVIPADAAVFSAWGMMMSDLRRDYIATHLMDLVPENAEAIENTLVETEDAARAQFGSEGVDPGRLSFKRFGKFRYQNQEHTTEVAVREGGVTAGRIPEIRSAFETEYEREYTYRLDAPVEMVGIHVTATAKVGRVEIKRQELGAASANGARKSSRMVDFAQEGAFKAAIYDGRKLGPGMRFSGPAIVEDPASTVVVHRGNDAQVDGFGNVVIRIHL